MFGSTCHPEVMPRDSLHSARLLGCYSVRAQPLLTPTAAALGWLLHSQPGRAGRMQLQASVLLRARGLRMHIVMLVS